MDFLSKYNINILTYIIPISLIAVAYFWITTLLSDHEKQKAQYRSDIQLEAISQYKNISSLMYWNTDKKYLKHSDTIKMLRGSMFDSDFSKEKDYQFFNSLRLTSLDPLNTKNEADSFERKGLIELGNNSKHMFYDEFLQENYNFIGHLELTKSCLECHGAQNNQTANISAGIRVTIPLNTYKNKLDLLEEEFNNELFFVIMLLSISFISIYFFQKTLKQKHKQIVSINEGLETTIKERTKELTETLNQTISAFVNLIESRDTYTAGHSRRVQYYANLIATYMNLDNETVQRINHAALVHDIGKINTPDAVLLNPGKLSKEEYVLIQLHAESGYTALSNIKAYRHLANIVKSHHERWDGNGYPSGISKENIPLESRIIAVADTFDAMTTNRIYKTRVGKQEALNEIQILRNKYFDPVVVDAALAVLGKVKIDTISQLPDNVTDEIRMSYYLKDRLTGLYNKEYLIVLLENGLNGRKFECMNMICLKNFHKYNQNNGWSAGNSILIDFSTELKNKYYQSYLFRVFGDDFVVLNFTHFKLETSEFSNCDILQETSIEVEVKHFDLRQNIDRKSIERMLGDGIIK
ncbi:MAG: HD domain-containing protein [Helicobacteraceae bacterium]|nr:HD domain-containing protein [Candidatus Sulfurimonas ponti]